MVDFDIEKLRELTAQDLNPRQLSALDMIRGIGQRQQRGIGTGSLTLGEIQNAEEISEAAPDLMEAGYGPQEYNPQQRYETRFSQRSAIDEGGDDAFQGLQSNIALGNAILPQQPTPDMMTMPQSTNPAWQPDSAGGGGDRGGFGDDRGFSPDRGTLGQLGMEGFMGGIKDAGFNSAIQGGLMSVLGLPASLISKLMATSFMTPSVLGGITGQTALGALGDLSVSQEMDTLGLDTSAKSRLGFDTFDSPSFVDMEAALATGRMEDDEAVSLGMVDAVQQMGMEEAFREDNLFGQIATGLQAAFQGPEGGWLASTEIDPVTGVHKGTLENNPMDVAAAMGLQSSFGDPFGIGLGGSANDRGIGTGFGGGGGPGGGEGTGSGAGTGGGRGGEHEGTSDGHGGMGGL